MEDRFVRPGKPPQLNKRRFHPSKLEDPDEMRRDFMGQGVHRAGPASWAGRGADKLHRLWRG